MPKFKYGPDNPDITYISHKYKEQLFDTGEIMLNYATTGSPDKPAIVLIPGQTESWWGYETAIGLLAKQFQVFAVDLRGQGRSSRTPGRYTFDNMGNDLVRFITFAVARPVIIAGLSSGGVLAAWLAAYAPPGIVRGAYCEDAPLFSCELTPTLGPSIRQIPAGKYFETLNKYLGDQWSIGDWDGLSKVLPSPSLIDRGAKAEPTQNLKEYDPEWGKATINGTLSASCDHAQMLSHVKCPILYTRHLLVRAVSDEQIALIEKLVEGAGQPFTLLSVPEMGHFMHRLAPELYVNTVVDWAKTLPAEAETKQSGVFAKK